MTLGSAVYKVDLARSSSGRKILYNPQRCPRNSWILSVDCLIATKREGYWSPSGNNTVRTPRCVGVQVVPSTNLVSAVVNHPVV